MYPGQYPGWSTPRVLAMLKSGSGFGNGPPLSNDQCRLFRAGDEKQNFIAGYF